MGENEAVVGKECRISQNIAACGTDTPSKAQVFGIVRSYHKKTEEILENIPVMKTGIEELMQDTIRRSGILVTLLAYMKEKNWRNEVVDKELNELIVADLNFVRDNNIGLKHLVKGMEEILCQSAGLVEKVSKFEEEEADRRGEAVVASKQEIAEKNKGSIMSLISWTAEIQKIMEEKIGMVMRQYEESGLTSKLNDSMEKIRKRLSAYVTLFER
jgi:hypothetical protein